MALLLVGNQRRHQPATPAVASSDSRRSPLATTTSVASGCHQQQQQRSLLVGTRPYVRPRRKRRQLNKSLDLRQPAVASGRQRSPAYRPAIASDSPAHKWPKTLILSLSLSPSLSFPLFFLLLPPSVLFQRDVSPAFATRRKTERRKKETIKPESLKLLF